MTRFWGLSGRLNSKGKRWLRASLFAAACLLATSVPARADTPFAYATAQADLRFGRIVVFGSGTRTITPAGGVTDSGILPATGDSPGPARFSVGYDKGNNGTNPITVVLLITFGTVPSPVVQGGVTATVTNLTSNLPGALTITPGLTVQVTLTNCRTRQCGAVFDVGGKLSVTRSYGGANITTPVPVSVTVVSVT